MTGSGHGTPESGLPWVDGGDDPTLESLDSARTKLVALCLARERSATLSELNALLGEPRCTLLRILGELADRGVVERVEGTYHFLGSEDDAGATADEADAGSAADEVGAGPGEDDEPTADDVGGSAADDGATRRAASEAEIATRTGVDK